MALCLESIVGLGSPGAMTSLRVPVAYLVDKPVPGDALRRCRTSQTLTHYTRLGHTQEHPCRLFRKRSVSAGDKDRDKLGKKYIVIAIEYNSITEIAVAFVRETGFDIMINATKRRGYLTCDE